MASGSVENGYENDDNEMKDVYVQETILNFFSKNTLTMPVMHMWRRLCSTKYEHCILRALRYSSVLFIILLLIFLLLLLLPLLLLLFASCVVLSDPWKTPDAMT